MKKKVETKARSETPKAAFRVLGDVPRGLRVARAKSGLDQSEIAHRAGVTQSMLSRYERGREMPRLETLDAILQALNVTLAEFAKLAMANSPEEKAEAHERSTDVLKVFLRAMVSEGVVDRKMIEELKGLVSGSRKG